MCNGIWSKKNHQTTGQHYQVAIKLNPPQRWKSAKDTLRNQHNIVVNFASSPNGGMYAGAYRYITKEDTQVFHGQRLEKHPELSMIGQNKSTAKANAAYHNEAAETEPTKKQAKHRRIDKLDLVEYIRRENLKTPLQLMAAAESKMEAGDRELDAFILKMNQKQRNEIIDDAWEMHNSLKKVEQLNVPRMTHIKKFACEPCDTKCDGQWLKCAIEVLQKKKINKNCFADALRDLMDKGRGKHRNILLVGERDCAKTFLLQPICSLFSDTFSNPASSTFSWLGVETAPAIFLNDFRWKPLSVRGGMIEWDAMLRMLVGWKVNLPVPMNAYVKHIKLTSDIPILSTRSQEVRFYKHDSDEPQTPRHRVENEMMESRWRVFNLTYQFKESKKIRDIHNCGNCFAKLILLGSEE